MFVLSYFQTMYPAWLSFNLDALAQNYENSFLDYSKLTEAELNTMVLKKI